MDDAQWKLNLAKRLREARANSCMTQTCVAESLGVPRTAVVKMEDGTRDVSSLELTKLSRLYGVAALDLMNGTGDDDFSAFMADVYEKIKQSTAT